MPTALILVAVLAVGAWASEGPDARTIEVLIETPEARVAGTLLRPEVEEPVPCVVIVGGTLSHTRDGAFERPGAPPRDALKRLAEALADGGYASLRYDRVGHGGSTARPSWTGTYRDESRVAAAVIAHARGRADLGPVIVAGESAGAYLACLAAQEGHQADAYLFLGGFCGTSEELYEYNFGRLARYVEHDEQRLSWARRHAPGNLAMGRHYREMLRAAAEGDAQFEIVDGDYRTTVGLERRREELRWPCDTMFRAIKAPALALAGAHDLNVPPAHAERIVSVLRSACNRRATARIIPGADHSFQRSAETPDQRIRDRHDFSSFRRPYATELYATILAWLRQTVPSPAGDDAPRAGGEADDHLPDDRGEVEPVTETETLRQ